MSKPTADEMLDWIEKKCRRNNYDDIGWKGIGIQIRPNGQVHFYGWNAPPGYDLRSAIMDVMEKDSANA